VHHCTGINETSGKFLPPIPLVLLISGGKVTTGVVDTGGVNVTSGKLPLVSTTTAANNWNNMRLMTPQSTYFTRDETGFLCLPTELERTLQLYC
jgi:hypothetical protein